jgi:hypothetical protein
MEITSIIRYAAARNALVHAQRFSLNFSQSEHWNSVWKPSISTFIYEKPQNNLFPDISKRRTAYNHI